jgi:hypothetical protein
LLHPIPRDSESITSMEMFLRYIIEFMRRKSRRNKAGASPAMEVIRATKAQKGGRSNLHGPKYGVCRYHSYLGLEGTSSVRPPTRILQIHRHISRRLTRRTRCFPCQREYALSLALATRRYALQWSSWARVHTLRMSSGVASAGRPWNDEAPRTTNGPNKPSCLSGCVRRRWESQTPHWSGCPSPPAGNLVVSPAPTFRQRSPCKCQPPGLVSGLVPAC